MLYAKHILTPYADINRIYMAHPDYQLCKAVISKVVLLRSFPSMISVPRDQSLTSSLYWKMCIPGQTGCWSKSITNSVGE